MTSELELLRQKVVELMAENAEIQAENAKLRQVVEEQIDHEKKDRKIHLIQNILCIHHMYVYVYINFNKTTKIRRKEKMPSSRVESKSKIDTTNLVAENSELN